MYYIYRKDSHLYKKSLTAGQINLHRRDALIRRKKYGVSYYILKASFTWVRALLVNDKRTCFIMGSIRFVVFLIHECHAIFKMAA